MNHVRKLSLTGLTSLLQGVVQACRQTRETTGESPLCEEQQIFSIWIERLTSILLLKYKESAGTKIRARALLVLMDSYEIVRNENLLCYILEQAEKLTGQLEDSPLKCKLLCYCYHYVEEPECLREARHIMESWDPARYTEEMDDAAKCYQELS